MQVGSKIKCYMVNKGITQSWLSKKTGVKKGRINEYLNERRKMPLDAYIKIINALEVSADFFINDIGDEKDDIECN